MGPWIAKRLRRIADRIDYAGAPKCLTWLSFTFEDRQGLVVNQDGRGCPLWYLNEADYERAFDEAVRTPMRVDWKTATIMTRPG